MNEATTTLTRADKDGTVEARSLIDKINEILYKDVVDTLKKNFPGTQRPDEWWWEGVPQSTRLKCDEQANRDNGVKARDQYLSLADYQTIVPANWLLFAERYDFGDKVKGKKTDKVSWIGRINKIRQTTHHPEKGIISRDEVAYVKNIYELVRQKITPGGSLVAA